MSFIARFWQVGLRRLRKAVCLTMVITQVPLAASEGAKSGDQNRILPRLDGDAYRLALTLPRIDQCSLRKSCSGCGVWRGSADLVPVGEIAPIIDQRLKSFGRQINEYRRSGHRINVSLYNRGNVANPRELPADQFDRLLDRFSQMLAPLDTVAISTRGLYVTDEILSRIQSRNPGFLIDFNIGVETTSERGRELFGKSKIDREFDTLFKRISSFNSQHRANFGLTVNFIYLPESYLKPGEKREGNVAKINDGFHQEIMRFVDLYGNKDVRLKINLHPFYRVPDAAIESSDLDQFMPAALEILRSLRIFNRNVDRRELQVTVFIGVQDQGYENPDFEEKIERWRDAIFRFNRGLDS
ncbi:MAG: hypothetical protein C5B49_05900 [Bdellovibrio sp.]|nr:MAG: hypothetical protein C5B49_05900 [Bdellovibrio sp.]